MNSSRTVRFLGVPMRHDQDTFVVPVLPGWRFVAATRSTFGAQLIYEKEEEEKCGSR